MTQALDSSEIFRLLLPLMVDLVRQNMELFTLRQLLNRAPTPGELMYYENQLWRRNLNRWWQDRQNAYRKIFNFVWG